MTDIVEDIRKKYKGTFCFLTLNGKEYLVIYSNDDGDNRFCLESPQFGEIIVDKETIDSCIRFTFPKNGLYNLNGSAVEYHRVPERQWKRAPCPDNSKLTTILSRIGIDVGLDTQITLSNLEEIYKEKYPNSIDEALKKIKYSTALSKKFAISLAPSGKLSEALLWFQNQPIGLINTSTRDVSIKYEHLYQEALDYFRKKETTWNLLPKAKQ